MNAERHDLSDSTSLLLDAIRFTAALAVLIGHATQPAFSELWPNLTSFSIAAVGAFFVMSGFVIAYTHPRHPDLGDFARARLTRLWSVVIPALVLTGVADLVSAAANPAYYAQWRQPISTNVVALAADAFFLNESWGRELSFGSDNPIWSLGYEAGYYALFGAATYLTGARRLLAIALVCAIKGPQLLVLAPVWLLGVLVCAVVVRAREARIPLGVVLFGLAALAFAFARKEHTASLQYAMALLPGGAGHSPFLFTMLACGLATGGLILLADSTDRWWGPVLLRASRPIRWLAQSTFSIYLFHLPTLILIQAVTQYDRAAAAPKFLTLATVFGVCVALSLLTERRKDRWDPAVRRLLALPARLASVPASPAQKEAARP